MKVIDKLTKAQEKKMDVLANKYMNIVLSTKPINKLAAKKYAKKLFTFLLKKEKPIVLFAKGPHQAWNIVTAIEKNEGINMTQKDADKLLKVKGDYRNFLMPYLNSMDLAPEIAWYKFMEYCGVKDIPDYSIFEDLMQFGMFFILGNYCIAVDRPSYIHMRGRKLYCKTGPALGYADGTEFWSDERIKKRLVNKA